jgi:DNA-directed RNA polymerase subunit H (RpoH/RPB5)
MAFKISNYDYIESVYRSRLTLLEILEDNGFNVEPFRKFSPDEISVVVDDDLLPGLNFTAVKKDDPEETCEVRYGKYSKKKLETIEFLEEIEDKKPEKTTIIIMSQDIIGDSHHIISYKTWMKTKIRLYMFNMQALGINPLKHVLVPKHEILPQEQHNALLESLYITSKSKLPIIRYHADPITRCIGARPGDIIKITRPSPSAGVYIVYRLCAP